MFLFPPLSLIFSSGKGAAEKRRSRRPGKSTVRGMTEYIEHEREGVGGRETWAAGGEVLWVMIGFDREKKGDVRGRGNMLRSVNHFFCLIFLL